MYYEITNPDLANLCATTKGREAYATEVLEDLSIIFSLIRLADDFEQLKKMVPGVHQYPDGTFKLPFTPSTPHLIVRLQVEVVHDEERECLLVEALLV